MIVIFMIALFEIQARLKYGTGQYDVVFTGMYAHYPENNTIGENMKLTRQLFPLIFQFVIVFCDLTLDAPHVPSEEELQEKAAIKSKFRDFAAR